MDLAALWGYEKARVSTCLVGTAVLASPSRLRKGSHASSSATGATTDAASASSVGGSSSHAGRRPSNAGTNGPIPQRKKTVSVFATRETLFRKLVEESASPTPVLARDGSATGLHPSSSSLFDGNEFSHEYAGRGAPASSATVSQPLSGAGAGSGASRMGSAASPTVRHHRMSARPSGGGASSLSASASSPALPTALAPQLLPPRKNARKRLAADLSAAGHAFRPYVGDMFSTRGDYVDGLLYMSRMKRGIQATFGAAGGRAAWGELAAAPAHARGNIKEALTDALLAASGGRMGGRHGGATGRATGSPDEGGGDGDGGEDAAATYAAGSVEPRSAGRGAGDEAADVVDEDEDEDEDGVGALDPAQRQQRRRRRRCARTLSNWSANPDNARLMVAEDVVEALIQLARGGDGEDGDRLTRLHCVTTLMNLSHLVELRAPMIAQGAVQTLAALVDVSEDRALRTACAIALCNLCGVAGAEEALVAHGAVGALALLINEHPRVARICRGALFNLTSVAAPYPKVESVLKVFLSFAASPPAPPPAPQASGHRISAYWPSGAAQDDASLVTARALCNLSLHKRLRLRLLEEGVVGSIGALLQPGAPLVQELLARVLLHLASLRACRGDLVAKGALGALVALTGGAAGSLDTKLLVAGALWHLSKEGELAVRMVSEGLLLLVNELARGDSSSPAAALASPTAAATSNNSICRSNSPRQHDSLLAVCAHTLYNVSCREDARAKLVERGAVALLSTVSRRVAAPDARKMCTLALCNLLSVQQAATEILQTGAVAELLALSSAPAMAAMTPQSLPTRRLFARALHGLCDRPATRVAVLDAGVVPAVLTLSGVQGDADDALGDALDAASAAASDPPRRQLRVEVRARCTAALASLAADPRTAPAVCTPAVVACVARLLARERGTAAIERFCCACLSLLCRDEACAQLAAAGSREGSEGSALAAVLAACVESGDLETKALGCQVLASLSSHASCGAALLRAGTVPVLAALAAVKERDPAISRCCAVTLANLSAEPAVRPALVSAGAVALLARLSNSYSEDAQRDCAAVLCNLSCIPGGEQALAQQGAVRALLMIAMVRAVSAETKDACLRALLNLLTADTIQAMVAREGLIKVLPAFAAQAPPALVALLFSKLLRHPVGRDALCSERRALQALFELIRASCRRGEGEGDASHERSSARGGPEPPPPLPDAELAAGDLTALHESLIRELVFFDNSRALSVRVGLVDALHEVAARQLAALEREEQRGGAEGAAEGAACRALTLVTAMFTLAKHGDTRGVLAAPAASAATLVRFLSPHAPRRDCKDARCAAVAVATLSVLSWHDDTRERTATPATAAALVQLLRAASAPPPRFPGYYPAATLRTCVLALCCLADRAELLGAMLEHGALAALHGILVPDPARDDAVAAACAADAAFVALACILTRHLLQTPAFAAPPPSSPPSTAASRQLVELVCALVTRAHANGDWESCLDCADALCSVVFGASPSPRPAATATASNTTTAGLVLVSDAVVASLARLMAAEQRPETRWRCCACLWALSSAPERRATLVELGVTRLLVAEATRAADTLHLSTLQCCAGAFCNLSLGPPGSSGASAGGTAAAMVAEGAVPALIALGRLDSDSVRELCAIALSNLSGPSPTVAAGAVAALLTLSLGESPPPPAGTDSRQSTAPLPRRPPFVSGERHKQFASLLPDYEPGSPADGLHALHERKFESALAASAPPAPRLPVLSAADLASDAGDERPAGSARARRSADGQTDPRPATPLVDSSEDGGLPAMPLIAVFPKVDPAEGLLALSVCDGASASASDGEDADDADGRRRALRGGNQDEDSDEGAAAAMQRQPARIVAEQSAPPTIDENAAGSARDESGAPVSTPAAALGSSSSLARVVGRKTQTVAAARRLKAKAQHARGRKPLMASGSLPSLPIGQHSLRSLAGAATDAPKRASLQSGLEGGSDRVATLLAGSSMSAYTDGVESEEQNQLQAQDERRRSVEAEAEPAAGDSEARAAIAAAAAAARLYKAAADVKTDASNSVEDLQRRARSLGLWS